MISQKYLKLLDVMRELHIAKNAGYSGDDPDPWTNFRKAEDLGVPAWKGCLIRLSDKFSRLVSLVKNPDNEKIGERLQDTLLDLASYALIAVCLLDELEN